MINVVHKHLVEELLILSILGFVLIQLQFGQFLLRPHSFLGSHLLLALIFLLLGCLDSLEFIEDILVVKNCVRELVTEVVLVQ